MVILLSLLIPFAFAQMDFGSEPITPLPEKPQAFSSDKIELGRRLFHDPRLSKNNTVSCASCHNLTSGGMDGKARSVGIDGALGGINAPTVFNSQFNFVQFWNGRAKTLEEQIEGPIQHPKEMGASWESVLKKLTEDKTYPALFKQAFPDGITRENVKTAIAIFEKQLITPDSRFDRFLRGDKKALSANELQGYQKFKSYGCVACHQGMNVGGNMFQTMGIMGNYFKDRGTPISEEDYGRFSVTRQEKDKFVFRVPSLRNVAETAPYFHDGSAPTLEKAVDVMVKYQLGRKIPDKDKARIIEFLKTLSGSTPEVVRAPASNQAAP